MEAWLAPGNLSAPESPKAPGNTESAQTATVAPLPPSPESQGQIDASDPSFFAGDLSPHSLTKTE